MRPHQDAPMKLMHIADRFLPPGVNEPETVRQLRSILLGSALGLFFSLATALSYFLLGSPWSGLSIGLISIGLLGVPFAVRYGVTPTVIGHVMTALTAQASIGGAIRSGGFSSPAMTWCFMLPIISYLAAGRVGSLVWSGVSLGLVGLFFSLERWGVSFAQDFSPDQIAALRLSGYAGVLVSTIAILMMVERVRVASQRTLDEANRGLERQRILRDMHDGVGSQLMGLLVRARSGHLQGPQLVLGLESCVDDLRLAVESLDPAERPLDVALGELRLRTKNHCDSAGIAFDWHCREADGLVLAADDTLNVLRACQEMLSNALKHSRAQRIEFDMNVERSPGCWLNIAVRDDGIGFEQNVSHRSGRGLPSLHARAQSLCGSVTFTSTKPGVEVALRFPIPAPEHQATRVG
jgi:signal transduction histidine kinase